MKRFDITRSYRLELRESHLFAALTILVGILAGLSAVLFAVTIDLLNRAFFGFDPSAARLLAMPVAVSLLTGVLMYRYVPAARGSGIPQTKAAYHLNDGIVGPLVPAGKFVLGTLAIGGGHALGREGPSVQIGAGLASLVGQWMKLPRERVRDLVPVGAAGALSAAFNTPVAAVIFALEEIIGDMNATLLGSTVVASVASVVVARSILGNEPLFHVPPYHLEHPAELLAYAALGIIGGIVAIIFTKALLGLRLAFRKLPASTVPWQPAMGGLVMGAILVGAPQLLGVGYDYVDRALNGGLLIQTALLLGGLKIAATVVSYSSGNPGGVFAPTLYIGAMTGAAVGMVIGRIAPFVPADPGAYALVGMGALFAGIIRAPLTSVFMIFELTQDYQIIVPLMVANLLSFYLSRRFQPLPLYHALLEQDDVHLPSAAARPATLELIAQDVMTPLDAPPPDRTAEPHAVHAHPDHRLAVLVERLAQSDGVLPIVSRADAKLVVGVVTVEGIMRALRGAGGAAAAVNPRLPIVAADRQRE